MRLCLPWFRSVAFLLTVLVAMQAVFPLAHLAWDHHHAGGVAHTDQTPTIGQSHDDDSDCQICHLLQATGHWLEPAPLPQVDAVALSVVELVQSPAWFVVVQPDIRSSSARGPPVALRRAAPSQS